VFVHEHICTFLSARTFLKMLLLDPLYSVVEGYWNVVYRAIRRGADKSLAFPICSTAKRIFLGWVKDNETVSVWSSEGNM
jgi:hypothetical protein